ncbi:DUF6968 family protein [Gynuella sp.]|uniref:DUF6968 family protein n=1 Tax=Gynuella sp. TaxID=2969146 RepID=UPI003D0AA761
MIPKIEKIEEVIATRNLVYISDSGQREQAAVEIGKPFRLANETFICPYRVASSSYEKLFGIVGIVELQALSLTLKTIESELIYWKRKKGGSFEF